MRLFVSKTKITLMAVAMIAGTAVAAEPRGEVVLNRNTYVRVWTEFGLMRLNSEALKSDGDELFGKGLPRLERYVKKLLKAKNYDWSKTDWRDVACYRIFGGQCGDDSAAMGLLRPSPPPPDWAKPGFEDSAFDRQYVGGELRTLCHFREVNSLLFRNQYIRTYFQVDDPASAGDLTLKIAYRGGARVLVNGEEIARGSLPQGALTAETFGADYPLDAYIANKGEVPDKDTYADWIGDLRCAFEMAPAAPRMDPAAFRQTYGNTVLSKEGWERVLKLRDRVLGPIAIPPRLLRKGSNVVAIELRSSRYHPVTAGATWPRKYPRGYPAWVGNMSRSTRWDHVGLTDLELRSSKTGHPPCGTRPAGFQVWVADLHARLYDRDYNPPGWPTGVVRFVGGRNGTYAAQLGTGTDRALTGLKATATDLTGEQGTRIPSGALAVQFMVGHNLGELPPLGQDRSDASALVPGQICSASMLALTRYSDGVNLFGPPRTPGGRVSDEDRRSYIRNFMFFDHITAAPPQAVPAKTCQPVWLSLKIPADAPAGKYKGAITVQADGVAPVTVPMEAEVIGWRVPSPTEFQTFVQSEQSPYGVAKAYKVGLWSDRHWQLLESSFRQLAHVGNRWLFVPVLMNSELGNREDAMIRWIRKKDGTLAFDYTLLDRYLATAQRIQGRPKAICFDIMQAVPAPTEVKVFDESTGKDVVTPVGPDQEGTRRPLWQQFGKSLYAHMKALGLEDVMYWGQTFDDVPDKGLIPIMAEAVPGVYWTSAGHGRGPDSTFRVACRAYGVDITESSFQGWKNPAHHLLMPRTGGSVLCVEGITTPFQWRVMCDRAIWCGFNGLGRIGADYFGGTWYDGVKGGYWCMIGRPCVQTLWPGENGVDSSARVEVMLEGIQEAEARIFLEQALDRKVLPDELARHAHDVLVDHFQATLHINSGGLDYRTMDISNNWQQRSKRLYEAAARAAEKTGIDVQQTVFGETSLALLHTGGVGDAASRLDQTRTDVMTGGGITVPALGRTRLTLRLRNWTAQPRNWTVEAADPWIIPEKQQGALLGQEDLGVILDGSTLKAGTNASGVLNVKDAALGVTYPISITAKVEKGVEFNVRPEVDFWSGGGAGAEAPHRLHYLLEPVMNARAGGDSKEFPLVNRTATKQTWKIESNCDWVWTEPSSGELPAGGSALVKIVARPKQKGSAATEAVLSLTSAAGAIRDEYRVKAYVIPPYTAPTVPPGDPVYLNELDRKVVKSHMEAGVTQEAARRGQADWWLAEAIRECKPSYHRGNRTTDRHPPGTKPQEAATFPYKLGARTFTHGLWVSAQHETVYNIEGAGFTAFAAAVGTYARPTNGGNGISSAATRVNYEIYVDGVLRAQSDFMTPADEPRLLVVDNLKSAKEVKLVTRRYDLLSDAYTCRTWGDPRFIKGK